MSTSSSESFYPQDDDSCYDSDNQNDQIQGDGMTESQYEQYYPTFDSETEYLFINKCLTLMHGPLPGYAYYQSNVEIVNFWNELSDEYFPVIYNYLIENEFLDDNYSNTPDLNVSNSEDMNYMKNAVTDFVYSYFQNRQ